MSEQSAENDPREALARVERLHNGLHWCFTTEQQSEVFEPGTKWWPCPTLAATGGAR